MIKVFVRRLIDAKHANICFCAMFQLAGNG